MSTHTHMIPQSKRVRTTEEIVDILRTVPNEKGFHFYKALGNFTGETELTHFREETPSRTSRVRDLPHATRRLSEMDRRDAWRQRISQKNKLNKTYPTI